MTTQKTTANMTVQDYDLGLKIFRSPDFGVDHPFRATRQIFGPTVLDTEADTHVTRKRSWIGQFMPAVIARENIQTLIAQAVAEGFDHAAQVDDLMAAAVFIPNCVLLLILGLPEVDPVAHHAELRGITDFLETNRRSEAASRGRDYLRSGPFAAARHMFGGLDAEKQANELLLFTYAAGETTYVAMKCLVLSWINDPEGFARRSTAEGAQAFLATNMRNDPPLGVATRYCKQATVIDGVSFDKGDLVHVDIVAANNGCPMTGTVHQDFTFGSGKHSCPGHLLAKAELEVVARHLITLDATRYRLEGKSGQSRPVNFRDPGVYRIRLVD